MPTKAGHVNSVSNVEPSRRLCPGSMDQLQQKTMDAGKSYMVTHKHRDKERWEEETALESQDEEVKGLLMNRAGLVVEDREDVSRAISEDLLYWDNQNQTSKMPSTCDDFQSSLDHVMSTDTVMWDSITTSSNTLLSKEQSSSLSSDWKLSSTNFLVLSSDSRQSSLAPDPDSSAHKPSRYTSLQEYLMSSLDIKAPSFPPSIHRLSCTKSAPKLTRGVCTETEFPHELNPDVYLDRGQYEDMPRGSEAENTNVRRYDDYDYNTTNIKQTSRQMYRGSKSNHMLDRPPAPPSYDEAVEGCKAGTHKQSSEHGKVLCKRRKDNRQVVPSSESFPRRSLDCQGLVWMSSSDEDIYQNTNILTKKRWSDSNLPLPHFTKSLPTFAAPDREGSFEEEFLKLDTKLKRKQAFMRVFLDDKLHNYTYTGQTNSFHNLARIRCSLQEIFCILASDNSSDEESDLKKINALHHTNSEPWMNPNRIHARKGRFKNLEVDQENPRTIKHREGILKKRSKSLNKTPGAKKHKSLQIAECPQKSTKSSDLEPEKVIPLKRKAAMTNLLLLNPSACSDMSTIQQPISLSRQHSLPDQSKMVAKKEVSFHRNTNKTRMTNKVVRPVPIRPNVDPPDLAPQYTCIPLRISQSDDLDSCNLKKDSPKVPPDDHHNKPTNNTNQEGKAIYGTKTLSESSLYESSKAWKDASHSGPMLTTSLPCNTSAFSPPSSFSRQRIGQRNRTAKELTLSEAVGDDNGDGKVTDHSQRVRPSERRSPLGHDKLFDVTSFVKTAKSVVEKLNTLQRMHGDNIPLHFQEEKNPSLLEIFTDASLFPYQPVTSITCYPVQTESPQASLDSADAKKKGSSDAQKPDGSPAGSSGNVKVPSPKPGESNASAASLAKGSPKPGESATSSPKPGESNASAASATKTPSPRAGESNASAAEAGKTPSPRTDAVKSPSPNASSVGATKSPNLGESTGSPGGSAKAPSAKSSAGNIEAGKSMSTKTSERDMQSAKESVASRMTSATTVVPSASGVVAEGAEGDRTQSTTALPSELQPEERQEEGAVALPLGDDEEEGENEETGQEISPIGSVTLIIDEDSSENEDGYSPAAQACLRMGKFEPCGCYDTQHDILSDSSIEELCTIVTISGMSPKTKKKTKKRKKGKKGKKKIIEEEDECTCLHTPPVVEDACVEAHEIHIHYQKKRDKDQLRPIWVDPKPKPPPPPPPTPSPSPTKKYISPPQTQASGTQRRSIFQYMSAPPAVNTPPVSTFELSDLKDSDSVKELISFASSKEALPTVWKCAERWALEAFNQLIISPLMNITL